MGAREVADELDALEDIAETELCLDEREHAVAVVQESGRVTIPNEVLKVLADHGVELGARSVEVDFGRKVVEYVVV